MSKLPQTLFTLAVVGTAAMLTALAMAQQARPQGPCDVYAAPERLASLRTRQCDRYRLAMAARSIS
jgi:hypothetical protein